MFETPVHFALALLAALQVKHLIFDFPLQTSAMIEGKGRYGNRWGLIHAALHALGSAGVFALFGVPAMVIAVVAAAEFLFHYHLDWGKERVTKSLGAAPREARFWTLIGADQMLHHLSYIAMTGYIVL